MEIQRKLPLLWEKQLFTLIILALLMVLYTPLILHWCDGWLNKSIDIEHEYFSHGIIGLPYAAYITWLNRQKWQHLENASHPLALLLFVAAALCYLTGMWDLVNLSLPLMLAGLCLWLKGIPGLRLNGFALLLVLLSAPNALPYLIAPYTLPLQKLIASTAGFILVQLGINVTVEEIYLAVGGRLVEVAPYCAGLKMLFTTLYVALMVLHWTDTINSRRKTISLLSGAIFISVAGNIIRNTLLTYFHGTGNEEAFIWLHDSWGGDVYSACLLGLVVVFHIKIVDKIKEKQLVKTIK